MTTKIQEAVYTVTRVIPKTPPHRVVNSNGELGDYASGLEKKKYLYKLNTTPK